MNGYLMRGCFFMLLSIAILDAQIERWVYRYSGPINDNDGAYSLVYGSDTMVYAAGYSYDSGTYYDLIVISLTSEGNERWIYRYNGPGIYDDKAFSIVYGLDGNIYTAGYSRGNSTWYDIIAVSLTSLGSEQWVYRYNGPGNYTDEAYSIVYGIDGNLYIAGISDGSGTSSDFVLISLTSVGGQQWVYRYNGPGNSFDGSYSISYGLDGNLYAAGYSYSNETYEDFTVISVTSSGNERWSYRYNGLGNNWDYAYSVAYGVDGNIYSAGCSNNTTTDFIVIKLDTLGTEKWVYTYNGPDNGEDQAFSVVCGEDGNIYIAGISYYLIGSYWYGDLVVVSLDTLGNERWVYTYNGPGNNHDCAFDIIYGSDENIYVAGYSYGSGTYLDFTVISLTSLGTENWVYRYNGPGPAAGDEAYAIVYGLDSNVYAAGHSTGVNNSLDFTIISLDPVTGVEEQPSNSRPKENFEILSSFFSSKISMQFSNSSNLPCKVSLYDVLGTLVYETLFPSTPKFLNMDDKTISKLPKGIYFLSISQSKRTYPIVKLIKL